MRDTSSTPFCASCSKFSAERPEHESSEAYRRCLNYAPGGSPGKRMMLVEREEHSHLLQLYEAVYNHTAAPTAKNIGDFRQRLEACNRFFSGGAPCR